MRTLFFPSVHEVVRGRADRAHGGSQTRPTVGRFEPLPSWRKPHHQLCTISRQLLVAAALKFRSVATSTTVSLEQPGSRACVGLAIRTAGKGDWKAESGGYVGDGRRDVGGCDGGSGCGGGAAREAGGTRAGNGRRDRGGEVGGGGGGVEGGGSRL